MQKDNSEGAAPGRLPSEITVMLQAAAGGDRRASEELLPLVYQELRKLAYSNMNGEVGRGAGNTLQPTALVHEAFLRLVGSGGDGWNSRGHFFGAAALAMRRILVDRARARNAKKRGGEQVRVELRDDAVAADPNEDAHGDQRAVELLAMDAALEKLKTFDERASQIVMLRYFAGLSVEQTAEALGLSPATIKKSWMFARAWLGREISRSQQAGE